MKKITFIVLLISAINFCSCKKDYNCECTKTTLYASGNSKLEPAETVTYQKIKKSEAKSICQNSIAETTNGSGVTTIISNNCKLK
ncbi:MAG: hypothetical protein Q7W45_13260 [Bacteroidota bacterium]|nr:hypothetical protein [Bacteroidota bacterium]MDP3144511.1 hypothetical protein [Bacteroidota bacterium]MDP3555808.1 hypothetical protein [Bacteroidota bacterium]